MHTLVFIPGIMGSEMYSAAGKKLWPPTGAEVLFGYNRMDALARDDVRHGPIISEAVGCFDVYKPLLRLFGEMGYREGAAQDRLILYPYDWRRDLHDTASAFAQRLDQAQREGATRITLVAHSMGGLVSRLAIENPVNTASGWLGVTDRLITLGTPHRGAALALARIMGLDSALGVSAADFRTFANDTRWPSGYQLLPAPGEDAIWDQSMGGIEALDIYQPATAARLGLDTGLLAKARSVHETLEAGRKPAHMAYYQLAGIGHETVMRLDIDPGNTVRKTTVEAGDGTVPIWSALTRADQRQVVVNEHASVFLGGKVRAALFRLFGRDAGVVRADDIEVSVSVPTPVIPAGEPFRATLSLDVPVESIEGDLMLQKLDRNGEPEDEGVAVARAEHDAGSIDHMSVSVPGIPEPGFYRLRFEGEQETGRAASLAISKPGD